MHKFVAVDIAFAVVLIALFVSCLVVNILVKMQNVHGAQSCRI